MRLALLAAALFATPALGAPFTVQETGKTFYRLDDAVKSANGGDATILIQPGTYHDCAIVTGGRVAFRAPAPGSVILDGTTCEGKAALVLRGRDAMVDGIVFQNMRVADRNGAGIRIEHGDLTVTNAVFRDSEEGILGADDPAATIRIDRSTFSGLGRCDGYASCAHSVYIGHYGNVIVTRSRFERGRGGHYLKVRGPHVEVTDNSFDDSQGTATNYAIDLPAGATGTIADNIFLQGRNKENHSGLIVVAAEARDFPSAGLAVTGNRAALQAGADFPTVFLIDFSHEPLKVARNQIASGIKPFETR